MAVVFHHHRQVSIITLIITIQTKRQTFLKVCVCLFLNFVETAACVNSFAFVARGKCENAIVGVFTSIKPHEKNYFSYFSFKWNRMFLTIFDSICTSH